MSHTPAAGGALSAKLPSGHTMHGNAPAFEFGELFARTLDWLSCGIVIVDHETRPIFANKAALGLIDSGRLPLSRKATVHRADPIGAIRRAVAAFNGAYSTATCRVGEPPLICTVASLAGPSASRRARAILFVMDSEQKRTIRLADVAGLGFTRAEAVFAVEFANGHSLQTCASRLGISSTTAKTHLQRIFEKTGASRQAELMRLILTSMPALRHDCEDSADAAE